MLGMDYKTLDTRLNPENIFISSIQKQSDLAPGILWTLSLNEAILPI